MKRLFSVFIGFLMIFAITGMANAAFIISPDSVFFNNAGEFQSNTRVTNTIDQSGLSAGFTSGVTDFDAYFGSPTHAMQFSNNEWWARNGVNRGTIIYDLGDVYTLDRLALWNEDAMGIASFELYTSLSSDFSSFIDHGTFQPSDNAYAVDYEADIFNMIVGNARYVKLVMVGAGETLGMGEIAFSANTAGNAVPEPATLMLFGLGLLGLAGINRKKN